MTTDSRARFPTTSWTLIENLQRLSNEQRRALFDEWLIRYWKPLYAYFRTQSKTPEQAGDLVQGFLCSFFAADKVLKVNSQQGRFRNWLLVCARHYLISEGRRQRGARRRPAAGIVSFEALATADGV